MSLPELFPTPRKISETGNSFTLPQELRFFCSDDSLSEGITPWTGKLPLNHAESIEQTNLVVQKESFWHLDRILPETGKRPDYAEGWKSRRYIPWAIQSISNISVSRRQALK